VGLPSPPVAPSDLLAIAFTSDWINMTWTDNSNSEDGFKVERCQGTAAFCNANPSQFAPIAQTGPNINYHGDTGLPAGTTYTYRVRAFNVSGNSAYSNTSTATTLGGGPPAPPSGLAAMNGPSGPRASRKTYLDLSWTDNSTEETSFVLERCQGAGCTNFGVRATLAANTVTYRDTNLPRGTTYRYRVKASNGSGDSGYSNIVTATTP
jgi:predicted phage tail protein